MTDHEAFQSPFTWRYGTDEMRTLWSLAYQRRLWRRIWVALAEVQAEAGLVTIEQVEDLRKYQDAVDLNRAHEIESEIHHDLMAEVHVYAEQCSIGGGIIHMGATSMDIEDNADALRLRSGLDLLITRLRVLLGKLADLIELEADHVCMAFTHLQPAEPTTVGFRLANYAQDMLEDWHALVHVRAKIKGKGFRGAVGTSASYQELLQHTDWSVQEFESRVLGLLDLEAFPVTHQTYPRRQDWDVINALAGLGSSLYRLAFDVRLLQSPPFGEWSEPFGTRQVGSSAMPFKRNPINAENIDSLARLLAAMPRIAWDNAAHSLLERTLDDSANRRVFLPEAFLTTEELIRRVDRIVSGLRIDDRAVQRNLETYGLFAATERVLMELARRGAHRQQMHEIIREHSLTAWEEVRQGRSNPLQSLLSADQRIIQVIPAWEVCALLEVEKYVGDAPERARALAAKVREAINN